MNIKVLFTIITVVAFLYLPSMADAVTWSYDDYYSYSEGEVSGGTGATASMMDDTLPLSTFAEAMDIGQWGGGSGSGTTSSISINSWADNMHTSTSMTAEGYSFTEFTGELTATNSVLNFTYSLDYAINLYGYEGSAVATAIAGAGITIYDITDGTTVYHDDWRYDSFSQSGVGSALYGDVDSGTLSVGVTQGNDIQITAGVWTWSSAVGNASSTGELNLDYQVTITPEPISSILFLTGGATLVLRSYRKRRKTA